MNSSVNQIFTNTEMKIINQVNYSHISEGTELLNSDINRAEHDDALHSEPLDHLQNNYSSNSSNVHYMPVTLPSPTFDMIHHQSNMFVKKSDVHHPNMQIYSDGSFSNISNTQLVQTSLPVLTPLNLNLKYVEYQSTGVAASSGSDSESLNEYNRTRSKRNLPHKKRLKKLNHEQQFPPISMQEDIIRVVQPNQPQFECTECSALIAGQLEFFMHLKEHYEPNESSFNHVMRKQNNIDEDETDESEKIHMETNDEDVSTRDVPENLIIESLEDSQDETKMAEMNGDAFEFSEPDDMEDFRKEVAKVVETIVEHPDSSWNYQVTDELVESHETIENYSNKLEKEVEKDLQESSYLCNDELRETCEMTNNQFIRNNSDNDDEEDNKPLNEVKWTQMNKKVRISKQKTQSAENDKEEIEFNECLKKINSFICNITNCNKTFNSRTALGYHLKTHNSERRFVCDQCGKKFLTNGALKVHCRLHTNERPYKCEHCEKSFRQWGDLRYHETSIHSDEKNHVCEFCAKCFSRKYSLVLHRKIHTGERNYKCTDCDKCFRASSYLKNHQRIHTGEKPHSCKVCQKRFRVQGDLKRHTKIHDRVKDGTDMKIKKKEKDQTDVDETKKLSTIEVSTNAVESPKESSKKTKKSSRRKNK